MLAAADEETDMKAAMEVVMEMQGVCPPGG